MNKLISPPPQIGNALVCLAVYTNHSMRTVTNIFIVNLAVADFFVILLCLPPTVVWDVTETWFLGEVLCKVVSYFQVCDFVILTQLIVLFTPKRLFKQKKSQPAARYHLPNVKEWTNMKSSKVKREKARSSWKQRERDIKVDYLIKQMYVALNVAQVLKAFNQ